MGILKGNSGFPRVLVQAVRVLVASAGMIVLLAGCAAPSAALPAAILAEPLLATTTPAQDPPAQPGQVELKAEAKAPASATPQPARPQEMVGKLILWHSLEGDDLAILEQALIPFRRSFPKVQIEAEYIPFDDLLERYQSAAAQGQGPTILLGSSTWGPELWDAGLIQEVGKIIPGGFLQRIEDAALRTVRYRGSWIGLPWSYKQGVVLLRNRALIPQGSFSLDELLQTAQAHTRGDVVGAIFDLGFYFSGAQMAGCNGQWMDAQGNPLFNSQTGYCWIDLLSGIRDAGVPIVINTDQDLVRFSQGRTALIIDGSWNIGALAKAIGAENLAIDPWPVTDKGRLSGFMETENLFLSSDLQPEDAAANIAFLRFMLTDSTQQLLADGKAGSRLPVLEGIQFEDQLRQELAAALSGDTPLPGRLLMDTYSAPLDQALRSIFLANVSKEEALDRAAHRIQIQVKDLSEGGDG